MLIKYQFVNSDGHTIKVSCDEVQILANLKTCQERLASCGDDPWLGQTKATCQSELEAIKETLKWLTYPRPECVENIG